MNLKEISIVELKAMAYDCLASIEINQNNIRAINAELQSRNQQLLETKTEVKKDDETHPEMK